MGDGMSRGPNGRLQDYLGKVAAEGEVDCALFQANCHLALTGVDLAAPWRGNYTSYREGLRAMRRMGYKNPKDFVRKMSRPVGRHEAITGDLCFKGNAGGVFIGNRVFLLGAGRTSLSVVDLDEDVELYRMIPQCQP